MAKDSGGSGFGGFILGLIIGVTGTIYGPGLYDRFARPLLGIAPGKPKVEVAPGQPSPREWQRYAQIEIEYSSVKANGQAWDWPMTAPEFQLCIQQGSDYRKCYGPKDREVADCQGKFQCTTAVIPVPAGGFHVELIEQDDYNASDRIGDVDCDLGQTCPFETGSITIRGAEEPRTP